MGMTVSGTVTYGKPLIGSLASMPAVVVAFSQAVIDKTYLTWLDVSKLLTAFPERVQVLGDTVTFQGPVAIISSLSPIQRLFAKFVIGIACCILTQLFFKVIAPKKSNQPKSSFYSFSAKTKRHIRIGRIFSAIAAVVGSYLAGRYLPTQAGIYFYGLPPYPLPSGIEA